MIALALLPSMFLLLAAAGFWRAHTYELRWVVTVCVAGLCLAALRDSLLWLVILLAILILFNPLYPVHVPRGTMSLMEAVAGICILVRGLSRA